MSAITRIYLIELGYIDTEGYLVKNLVCDLHKNHDSAGLTKSERGAVGLGNPYGFPYVTPECLAVIDASTLMVANDNNYPMSVGRRPPNTPDDNEIILLRLDEPLWGEGDTP
jgi:glycerophosphoryl diester phosphodiesterase